MSSGSSKTAESNHVGDMADSNIHEQITNPSAQSDKDIRNALVGEASNNTMSRSSSNSNSNFIDSHMQKIYDLFEGD